MLEKRVRIVDFEEQYAGDFCTINMQWLETYFYVEDYDKEVLSKPQEYILDKGGHIFFALLDEKVVGTVALISRESDAFELSKMGVLPDYRGLKIGFKLMEVAIQYCRDHGKDRVWLESNRLLTPALALYGKMGFVEVPTDPDTPYERCDIRMEMILNSP